MNIYFTLIVKDEAPVLRRCLDSLLPAAPDGILIHDTGSTDGTEAVARAWALDTGTPLTFVKAPWGGFGISRSRLLKDAYLRRPVLLEQAVFWMIDADDVLTFTDPNPAESIRAQLASDHDIYDVTIDYSGVRYTRPQIVRNTRAWEYEGVIHEYLVLPPETTRTTLHGVTDTPIQDGARSRDPEKFEKDAETLYRALRGDISPGLGSRYRFYYAQCLRDAGSLREALEAYLDRLDDTAGYQEERYVAAYNALRLAESVYPEAKGAGMTEEQYRVLCCVLDGFECSPSRWELQHQIVSWCWRHGRYQLARRMLPNGVWTKDPPPGLFIESGIYQWSMADQAAITLYFCKEYQCSFTISYRLLQNPHLPATERLRVLANLGWAAEHLSEFEKEIHAQLLNQETKQ